MGPIHLFQPNILVQHKWSWRVIRCVSSEPSGILALDNQWTNIVSTLLIVLVVRAVTVRKLLRLPAATEDCFVANVFNVNRIDYLRVAHVNLKVDTPPLQLAKGPVHKQAKPQGQGCANPWQVG